MSELGKYWRKGEIPDLGFHRAEGREGLQDRSLGIHWKLKKFKAKCGQEILGPRNHQEQRKDIKINIKFCLDLKGRMTSAAFLVFQAAHHWQLWNQVGSQQPKEMVAIWPWC